MCKGCSLIQFPYLKGQLRTLTNLNQTLDFIETALRDFPNCNDFTSDLRKMLESQQIPQEYKMTVLDRVIDQMTRLAEAFEYTVRGKRTIINRNDATRFIFIDTIRHTDLKIKYNYQGFRQNATLFSLMIYLPCLLIFRKQARLTFNSGIHTFRRLLGI